MTRKPDAPSRVSSADLAAIAISLIMAAAGAGVVFAGPDALMPVHWGPNGQADGWAGREVVGGMVLAAGLFTLLLGGGMGLAAARTDEPGRRRALRYAQLVVLLTLPLLTLAIGSASLSGLTSIGSAAPMAVMGLLFLLLGAFLGRVGPNPFVGVRTPWAYKSRLAWERSNRLAGRLFFLLGLGGLSTAAFAPQPLGVQLMLGGVVAAAVWSVVESWRVWRTDPDRQPF